MKHETLTIWSAEDFARPEKLEALRVGDEVAFQLKNGKEAAFVVEHHRRHPHRLPL